MRAGNLDRRITLRHRVLTKDDTNGEEVVSFEDYATVWAEKRDLRGREFFAAQQVNSETSTVWRIRYRSDVLPTDRIAYDGVSYNITGIAQIGRKHGLELQSTATA